MYQVDKKWFEAAKVRHSKRRYIKKELNLEVSNKLYGLIDEINNLKNGIRFMLIEGDVDSVFKGIIGSYGRIQNAPACVVFTGSASDADVEEKIGYYGESFILEAASLGLGTCWISGSYNPETAGKKVNLKEDEKVYAVSPVGYADENPKFSDKLFGIISHGRKELKDLCSGIPIGECPEWIKNSLELARIAPSAANMQPWRFYIEKNSIIVSEGLKKIIKISPRLNCGIAMQHIEVGAVWSGISGEWEYLKSPEVAQFKIKSL